MNGGHMQYLFAPVNMAKEEPVMNGIKPFYHNKMDQLRLDLVKGDLKGVEGALEKGITADHVLRGDWNLLMYASSLGHYDIVRLLLKKGANPNSNKDRFTPLMTACASRREQHRLLACVRLLLEHGADVNARDRFHVTALMYAAREGHADIVTYLLGAGANVQLRDERGWTALFWAINSERKTATVLLLQAESALYRQNAPELTNEMSYLDSQIERDTDLISSKITNNKIANGVSNGTHRKMELQLYSILKAIGELESHLKCHYLSLDTIRCSLHDLAVSRPLTVWPLTSRQLPVVTQRALCASERLFQQIRFLHRVTEKVVESDDVKSADYIVEKKTSPLQAWMTFLITSAAVTVALWHIRDLSSTSTTYSFTGS